jgi:hypothetical protein
VAAPPERDVTHEVLPSNPLREQREISGQRPRIPRQLAIVLGLGLVLRLGLVVWLYGTPLYVTDEHDYEFKKNHAMRFLQQGDKVKASVFFRGREIVHQAIGRALLERLVQELGEVGTVENRAKMEGPNLVAIISPKKS